MDGCRLRMRGEELTTQAQGAVRALYEVVEEKVRHLDLMSWLLARLGEPGVRGRVLWQWGQVEPRQHHRKSARC